MSNIEKLCPNCDNQSKSVGDATVKAIVNASLRRIHADKYYFCTSPDCDIVYFDETKAEQFTISEIRERVYQKQPDDREMLICYCFQYTVGDVLDEVQSGTDSFIVEDINAGIKAGQCACDWRNPQGTCCLGNVLALRKAKLNKVNTDEEANES